MNIIKNVHLYLNLELNSTVSAPQRLPPLSHLLTVFTYFCIFWDQDVVLPCVCTVPTVWSSVLGEGHQTL